MRRSFEEDSGAPTNSQVGVFAWPPEAHGLPKRMASRRILAVSLQGPIQTMNRPDNGPTMADPNYESIGTGSTGAADKSDMPGVGSVGSKIRSLSPFSPDSASKTSPPSHLADTREKAIRSWS